MKQLFMKTQPVRMTLFVISTIGRTGLDYLMLGSTAASVVRHVNIPRVEYKSTQNRKMTYRG